MTFKELVSKKGHYITMLAFESYTLYLNPSNM